MPYMHLTTFRLSRLRNSPPIGTWGAPSCSQTVGSIPAEKQHKGSFALCWVAVGQSRVGISFWTWLWSNQEKSSRENSEVFNKVVLWGDSISTITLFPFGFQSPQKLTVILTMITGRMEWEVLLWVLSWISQTSLCFPTDTLKNMRYLEKQPGALSPSRNPVLPGISCGTSHP